MRINYEPVVIQTPDLAESSGRTATQVTKTPLTPTGTITIGLADMPFGGSDRIVGAGLEVKGERIVVWQATMADRQFGGDLTSEANLPAAWLLKLDVRDTVSDTVASYYMATTAGWSDGELPAGDAWQLVVTDVRIEGNAATAVLSVAADDRWLDEPVQSDTMPGLDLGIHLGVDGTEASGRMIAPHDASLVPSTNLRVDVVYDMAGPTATSMTLAIKGGATTGPTAEWSLIVLPNGGVVWRLVDVGGSTISVGGGAGTDLHTGLHHVVGYWDGTDIYIMADGAVIGGPVPLANCYAGRTGDLSFGRFPGGAFPADLTILTARVTTDAPTPPTSAEIAAELFAFAGGGSSAPAAEWKITAGVGAVVVNTANHGTADAILSNAADPTWSPWVYPGTGTEADGGRPWPRPYGSITVEPSFGDRELPSPVAHLIGPSESDPVAQIDYVSTGGLHLQVDDPNRPATREIKWQPAPGGGGMLIDDFPLTGPPQRTVVPFLGFRPGATLDVTGTAPAAPDGPVGTLTVTRVVRESDEQYGRVMYVDEQFTTTGSSTLTIIPSPGTVDVTLRSDNRTLEFGANPTGPVRCRLRTTDAGLIGPVATGNVYGAVARIVGDAGITWPVGSRDELQAAFTAADYHPAGLDPTNMDRRTALDLIILGLGGWSYGVGRSGEFDVSDLVVPDGGPVDLDLTDRDVYDVKVLTTYPPQPLWTVTYRRNAAPLDDGDLFDLARQQLTATELRRITEPVELATSNVETAGLVTRGALSGERRELDSALVVKSQALAAANRAATLFGRRLRVVSMTGGLELSSARPRRTAVKLTSNRIPRAGAGIYGVVVSTRAADATVTLQILTADD